ncbi:MAG: dihydroorotate dehydrogenase electron transfer subunit [Planctomycetes bacterium]|nr:dihydroorotate dehydrogenase electron transfer subunit [Planctomycetota bacterium]
MTDQQRGVSYADRAWHGTVEIDQNVRLARDTFRVRLRSPQIASQIVPGQFVMLRLAESEDPLLGRPLALYDVVLDANSQPIGLDVAYLVVGKMTGRLAGLTPGAALEIWGPLGNGFGPIEAERLVMVAGGIGQTPFLALAREALGLQRYGDDERRTCRAGNVTLCYGVRSKDYLAGLDDFERAGVDVRLSTDDGSAGHRGLVTELVRPVVEESSAGCRIVCCGPEPMMAATAAIARELATPCQVSLETPMACGIGACFSCVARVRDAAGQWDYRRTCVEGPVFDAEDVEF